MVEEESCIIASRGYPVNGAVLENAITVCRLSERKIRHVEG